MTHLICFKHSIIACRFLQRLASVTNTSCRDHRKHLSTSHINNSFYEKDRRGAENPVDVNDIDWKEHVLQGREIFIEQSKLFWEEIKEHLRNDPKIYTDGDTDVFFRFESKDTLKKWRIASDKSNNEGFSECSFMVNDKSKGVFSGNIDTTPPKDGTKKFAGYCGIKSVRKTKSYLREDYFDWSSFTHLELRVKGDGRNYAINLGIATYFDVSWFDTFSYTIFTHGGPYWQLIRIPFSKFYLSSKGRLQDKQCAIPLIRVNSVGITCAGVPGPFCLEIDYIGCHVDRSHKEKFAYELYDVPKEFVSS